MRLMPLFPFVEPTRGMNRRGSDHEAAFAAQINTRRESDPATGRALASPKIDMPPAATGENPYCIGQRAVVALQIGETLVSAMSRIHIEDNEPGNRASHDTKVRIGPAFEPLSDLGPLWTTLLKLLPTHQRYLAAVFDWNDRPASR